MVNYCVVPCCKTKGGFKFPCEENLRKKWVSFVNKKRRFWSATPYSRICHLHFTDDDFIDSINTKKRGNMRKNRLLKDCAVPTIFRYVPKFESPQLIRRRQREIMQTERRFEQIIREIKEERDKQRLYTNVEIEVQCEITVDSICEDKTGNKNEVVLMAADVPSMSSCTQPISFLNQAETLAIDLDETDDVEFSKTRPVPKPQCMKTCQELVGDELNDLISKQHFLSTPYISIERIKLSAEDCRHYTGLSNYDRFLTVFYSLGSNVHCLKSHFRQQSIDFLEPQTAFLLTLVYLRCHYPTTELGRMFCLSEFTVRNIVYTWIKFCALQWREVNIWPEKNSVDVYCPKDFKRKYRNTRVILDGTEIPISKPKNPTAQRASFSTYKHRNTVKVLIGATPGGQVSYVSEAYGGAASDRQIVERSDLIEKVERNDVIMADKGFNVEDIFITRDVKINMPSFFKKTNRLTPAEVSKDKSISSKRVHIERIIGNAKTYRILKCNLNSTETLLSSDIIFVCFMLTNFRKCIVPKNA